MSIDWSQNIAFITLCQLLLLAVVTFNYKKGKQLSNRILSGFMISNALLIAHYLFSQFQWISPDRLAVWFYAGGASYLLLMPFLYLYIYSLCYKDFQLKPIHLLHAIPFFLNASFSLSAQFTKWSGIQSNAFVSFQHSMVYIEPWATKIILHGQILTYLIITVKVLVDYRARLKETYSSIEKIDLSWCNLILAAFAAMWFLDFLIWLFHELHIGSNIILGPMFTLSLLINLTFTLAATYRGLAQSTGFSGIQTALKYATSNLQQEDCEIIIQKLITYMEKEKPYLSPTLTVDDLARKLNVPVKQLSQSIHVCLNQNFYDLVNAKRIEEATLQIKGKKYQNQTLLALAFDVGFSTKSVFNAAFKKHTGMIPKEYRRQCEIPAAEEAKTS